MSEHVTDPGENHRELTRQILALDPTYPYRYESQPEFRAAVVGMVNLAPTLLRVAAEDADKAEAHRRAMQRQFMHRQGPSAVFPGFPQS